eukprot:6182401-Pleurochrysis_carterae.AAC.2
MGSERARAGQSESETAKQRSAREKGNAGAQFETARPPVGAEQALAHFAARRTSATNEQPEPGATASAGTLHSYRPTCATSSIAFTLLLAPTWRATFRRRTKASLMISTVHDYEEIYMSGCACVSERWGERARRAKWVSGAPRRCA